MTAPAGPIMLAEKHLRDQIANTPSFLAWSTAADATAALDRIYYEALPTPANRSEFTLAEHVALRPYTVLWLPEEGRPYTMQRQARGESFEFRDSGVIMSSWYKSIADADKHDPSEIKIKFVNELGIVLRDIWNLAGEAGHLDIESISVIDMGRSHEDLEPTEGSYYAADVEFAWGVL